MNYYNIFTETINRQEYNLQNMISMINAHEIMGNISKQQTNNLLQLAREKANPKYSYGPIQSRLQEVFKRVDEITKKLQQLELTVKAIENKIEQGGAVIVSEQPEIQEWPEYNAPSGAHDSYHKGDKITYNGKHYVCIAPQGIACAYSPDVYPAWWELQS